jgi:hypothetical protein
MSHDAFDRIDVRCPQLGGEVTFAYCRELQNGLPCPRALICFELRFPVEAYFRRVLEKQTFERLFNSKQPSRLERLFRAVDAARKTERKDD